MRLHDKQEWFSDLRWFAWWVVTILGEGAWGDASYHYMKYMPGGCFRRMGDLASSNPLFLTLSTTHSWLKPGLIFHLEHRKFRSTSEMKPVYRPLNPIKQSIIAQIVLYAKYNLKRVLQLAQLFLFHVYGYHEIIFNENHLQRAKNFMRYRFKAISLFFLK